MFLAAATVFFRDIMHIWSVFVTALLYFSAIFYDPTQMTFSIGGFNMQQIIKLNPMYWYITGFRRTLMWGIPLDFNMLAVCGVCALALGAGVFGAMMQSGGFETMFVGMHRMLFINDNWLLNPATDILIRMMPQNLFETALADVLGQFARALVLSILLLAAAYAVVSSMVKRQLTQTEERP